MQASRHNEPGDYQRGGFRKEEGAWWSGYIEKVDRDNVTRHHTWTKTWSVARDSRAHLRSYGLARSLRIVERPRVGDLVYYKLNGRANDWSHAAVVVRVTKRDFTIAQHTADKRVAWSEQVKGIRADHGEDWDADFLRPLHTAANSG